MERDVEVAQILRERLKHTTMKPIIGISVNYKEQTSRIADAYVQAVHLAGGVPLLIPVLDDKETLENAMRQVDGLLMSGGADIDPSYFNETPIPELGDVDPKRDFYDCTLIDFARRHQLPILGICRGMQVLNVCFGGTLYQDIYAQHSGQLLNHDQSEARQIETHTVTVTPGSKLSQIIGSEKIGTNTFHHQAVKDVAQNLCAVASSSDGICEAIESNDYPIIGVQWHPENLALANKESHIALFQWLINEAKLFREARLLHETFVSLDSHCDTPMVFTDDMNLGERTEGALVDFVKMDEGRLDAIFMAAYIPQRELDEAATKAANDLAKTILERIHTQLHSNGDKAMLALTADAIETAKQLHKKAVTPALENGYAIGTDLSQVEQFYNAGVRYITLCHNGDNAICDSAAKSQHTHNGISNFGKQVIAEMDRLGIMVDISHVGEKSFWDALAYSKNPVIASHSSARALCDHPRNLTDEQLKALAKKGGVCQVCLYEDFLSKTDKASLQTAVDHIDHIVKTVGIDFVGIGSDFDGGGGILGCQASNELINITKELLRRGYSHDDIRKIWGGNLLRVMRQIEANAQV